MRQKLLNKFCYKISNISYLFFSEEIKLFLNTPTDVVIPLESLPKQSYEDIYEKYKQAFGDIGDYEAVNEKHKINEFLLFLKKGIINIKNFKEKVSDYMNKKAVEMDNYYLLFKIFSDYENNSLHSMTHNNSNEIIFESSNQIRNKVNCHMIDNPYSLLLSYLQEQEIDFEAMIEAINSLFSLYDADDKLIKNIHSLDSNLKTLKSGKSTLKSMFNFKSKEENIDNY